MTRKFLTALCLVMTSLVYGQDDMMNMLDEPQTKEIVRGTFKGTRLINMHTTEMFGKHSLDFRISHRFADFTTGSYNFWGLDGPSNIQLRFDYSILDNLTVGIGRTSFNKLFDGFVKYKFIKQKVNGTPVTMVVLSSINLTTEKDGSAAVTGYDKYAYFSDRLSYNTQILISRKFNSHLSMQVTPTYIHYNMVIKSTDKNDILAIGLSGRYKFSKRMAVTTEYIPTISKYSADMTQYFNSFSLGVDIETGGHVFQLFLTNSTGINEVQFIPYTTGAWSKGEIRLGFNISRVFSVGGKREKERW